MLRALAGSERGATAIEYGLIAALIVIAMVGGLSVLGAATTNSYTNLSNKMP